MAMITEKFYWLIFVNKVWLTKDNLRSFINANLSSAISKFSY